MCSTGDELVASGPLAPGLIRDSNRPMLLAVLEEAGCEPVDFGIARDDEAVITATMTRAVDECDALVTSGAVSMGDYDFVKVVLERLAAAAPGSTYSWMQIAIKPAKPFAFAAIGGVPVFGLPGNPVSSRVSFELLARPALRRLAGSRRRARRPRCSPGRESPLRRRPDGRVHFDRVTVRVRGRRLRVRARRGPGQQRALGHGRGHRPGRCSRTARDRGRRPAGPPRKCYRVL